MHDLHPMQEPERVTGQLEEPTGPHSGGVEEGEDDTPTSLESALSYLGLSHLAEVFEKEQIDFDSLVSGYSESVLTSLSPLSPLPSPVNDNKDLKELGIPMGPRKKLLSFISTQGEIRAAKVGRSGSGCVK